MYDVSQNAKSLGLLEIIPDNCMGPLLTLRYMAAPLQNETFNNPFFFMLETVQI